jgi:hypothetical protein
MSFIQKSDAVTINTKLTNIGRLLLASGNLTFKKIEFGDSEIDYNFLRFFDSTLTGSELSILRPKDANPIVKYPIPISETSTDTKIDINSVTPDIRLVVNTAKERGFFTGSTSSGFTAFTSTTYVKGFVKVEENSITGGTDIELTSVAGLSVGDMLLIDWRNPKLVSFTDDTGVIGENYPRPFLWYKVQAINGNNVTLDRNAPDFDLTSLYPSIAYFLPQNNAIDNYYSTGTTVAYWNYNTLAFDSTCNIGSGDDVPVWNLNIVYKDTPIGVTNGYTGQYYDGAIFSGFKEYVQGSSTFSDKSQLAIIHYTNKSISNYYGEAFYNDTFSISLPTIMYHGKLDATMGIVLSANTKQVQPTNLSDFKTEYYDLVETTSGNKVGKVFNDLRVAVIEDEELVNVLALKSDRSHTLPSPIWGTQAVSTNPLLSQYTNVPTQYLALTYLFTSNGYDTNSSYGFRGGIHCGYVKYIEQSDTFGQDVTFYFREPDLKFMSSNVTLTEGGFNVNNFYILAQLVTFGTKPNPANWKLIDYTPNLRDYNLWNGVSTIPVTALTISINTLTYSQYTAGTTYDITQFIGTIPTTGNYTITPQLGFGEESILFGNINSKIKATVYKTKLSHTLGFSNFNTSSNPTWDDDDVYITEAGIYDQNNSLVAIGKLNNPVKKNTNKIFTIELDMDF